MFSEFIKITAWGVLALICYTIYDQGIRPYAAASSETDRILLEVGIFPEEKHSKENYERAIKALEEHCTNGVYEVETYEFRCVADSPVPYILGRFLADFD